MRRRPHVTKPRSPPQTAMPWLADATVAVCLVPVPVPRACATCLRALDRLRAAGFVLRLRALNWAPRELGMQDPATDNVLSSACGFTPPPFIIGALSPFPPPRARTLEAG